jgi:hypothetical protein
MTAYAKITEQNTLQFPTPEDYNEDGTFVNPIGWLEFTASDKPEDTKTRTYVESFMVFTDPATLISSIVQTWNAVPIEPVGRVARLSGTSLVFPNRNETLSDGTLICNFPSLPNSQKLTYGWFLVKETEYPTDGKLYKETGTLVEDPDYGSVIQVVWEFVEPVPEPAFSISKIKLGDTFDAIGVLAQFEAYIASDAKVSRRWRDAVVLMSDDPMVLGACGYFQQMLGMTDAQIKAMLVSCKSDIG